jgi:hypothetical protein
MCCRVVQEMGDSIGSGFSVACVLFGCCDARVPSATSIMMSTALP